jgi:PRD1 phage membrane DNA delivery
MNSAVAQIVAVFSMIIGVAIVAVLVSKNANTAGVINSAFGGLSTAIGAAVSPVTGGGGGIGGGFGGVNLSFN